MPSVRRPSRRGRRTGSEASSSHLKVLGSLAHDESKQTRPKIAPCIDIYTQSHNLYPAQMFCDRLLSAGSNATCHESPERLVRTALATGANHAAVAISYSGLNQQLDALYG